MDHYGANCNKSSPKEIYEIGHSTIWDDINDPQMVGYWDGLLRGFPR